MTDNSSSEIMAMSSSGGSVLQATLNNGINCNVRVILNNTNVSPPPPSDDDDMMEEDVVGGDGKLVCVSIVVAMYYFLIVLFWGRPCWLLPALPLDFNINPISHF